MFRRRDDHQIFRAVIVTNAVDVMNLFLSFQRTAEKTGHDMTVFQHALAGTNREDYVAFACLDESSAFPHRMSGAGTMRTLTERPTSALRLRQMPQHGGLGDSNRTRDGLSGHAGAVAFTNDRGACRAFGRAQPARRSSPHASVFDAAQNTCRGNAELSSHFSSGQSRRVGVDDVSRLDVVAMIRCRPIGAMSHTSIIQEKR